MMRSTKGMALFLGTIAAFAHGAPAFSQARHISSSRAPVRVRSASAVASSQLNPNLNPQLWSADIDFRFKAQDIAAIIANEGEKGSGIPLRVGVNQALDGPALSLDTIGKWSTLPDETIVWTAKIELPGAKGARLHVSRFEIPAGAELIITSAPDSPGEIYSSKSVRGETEFWTTATAGPVVFLALRGLQSAETRPAIEIDEASYLYRWEGADDAVPDPQDASETAVLPCHEDVNCHSAPLEARDAVGRIQYTVLGQGTFVCSGALLNDTDPNTFAGYFLTAAHCIDTQAKANTITVSWFFQSDSCAGPVPNVMSRPKSSVAKLLVVDPTMDLALLRLNDDPESGQGLAGWTDEPPSRVVRTIHHPGGSYKRFTEGELTTEPPTCNEFPRSKYFYNDWSIGVTEDGSSGAPIFNPDWEVVGQQYGACRIQTPGCSNPQDYNNMFGRLSAYLPLIQSYLESITPDDPYEDTDSMLTAAELPLGTHALRLLDMDDYFWINFNYQTILTAKAAFNTADMDLDLYLFDESGQLIAQSIGTENVERISQPVSPGTYYLRVNKDHGWGGNYSLEWTAYLPTCPAPPKISMSITDQSDKPRFISFVPPQSAHRTAIRVVLKSLHHPDPPYGPFFAPQDLHDWESKVRWLGPWTTYDDLNGASAFRAATLQCEPYYANWGAVGEINVYGGEILPSSVYDVEMISEYCDPRNPANYSDPLVLRTARWGDVVSPFQQPYPAPLTQPNIQDVTAVAAAFRASPGAISKRHGLLQPAIIKPFNPVSVLDIAAAIDAFQGFPYALGEPSRCP